MAREEIISVVSKNISESTSGTVGRITSNYS